jgi:hypothetical protein
MMNLFPMAFTRRVSGASRLMLPLLMGVLACTITPPSPPKPPLSGFSPSLQEATAFEQSFQSALQNAAQSGTFTVTVTQNQLSSWLALRGPEYAKAQGYDVPVKDVQAALDGGRITLYGVINQPNVPDTPAQIVFTPSIDADGQLAVKVESSQVGVVGVPASVTDNLTKTIRDSLESQLGQVKGRYRLTRLTLSGGSLTVSGQIVR